MAEESDVKDRENLPKTEGLVCGQSLKAIKNGFLLTLFFVLFFGGLYPLLTFFIGQILFPFQAGGSLLFQPKSQALIGSKLIAQNFTSAIYFTPRPSFFDYNAAHSGGSQLGPTSKKLMDDIQSRSEYYRRFNQLHPDVCIPIDAVTISSSSLDPHISLPNALLQAPRVAKVRKLPEEEVMELIQNHTERPLFGLIGEPRVNVLMLNLALDHTIVEKEE
jgi:potassium-transporting ATPase KdpC subunit